MAQENTDSSVDETSNVSFIDVKSDDPFVLFRTWFEEAKDSDLLMPETMTLATANSDAKVSARSLLLRRLDDDGFVILTDGRSQKSRELEENPNASLVFLWAYKKNEITIWRQVRVQGRVVELERQECQSFYNDQPLFCRIRSHLCHQGAAVDWQKHKLKHDQLLKEVKEGRKLDMPDCFVGYKLLPDMFDFYFTEVNSIADRALFVKRSGTESWTHHKIAA